MNQFNESEIEQIVLTPQAVDFLIDMEEEFGWRRGQILAWRDTRQQAIDQGELPDFDRGTSDVRTGDWNVAPIPDDLRDRRVEITGPVDAKMMINALNSGAMAFMADFEDATSPVWENLLEGHLNIVEAYEGTLELKTAKKHYTLDEQVATLLIRPRGWHLGEKHFLVDGQPMSASLFDFGLYMFHGARAAIRNGTGPYVYLPKLESHLEARLWNDVFIWTQSRLEIPARDHQGHGSHRERSRRLRDGRDPLRDKGTRSRPERRALGLHLLGDQEVQGQARVHPADRSQVTMEVPFMAAYTELMVKTCHRRGAHAIGGMAAFIPSRSDPDATVKAMAAVSADKAREAEAGCDGTWVAHPDLVQVAMTEFDLMLGTSPNQVGRQRDDVEVDAADLLDLDFPGEVTMDGVRTNVSIGIQYLATWLAGTGAAAINNLMEDVATAEISRSQVWQWVHHGVSTSDGSRGD